MRFSHNNTTVDIPIEGHSNIGIRLSGGADSAILLSLICESIVRLGVQDECKVIPITIHWDQKPFNLFYSGGVLDLVRELYPSVNIIEPRVGNCKEFADYSTAQRELERSIYQSGLITVSFSGVTENPPEDSIDWDGVWHMRDTRRDPGDSPDHITHADGLEKYYPFIHINKRGVADMYDMLGLLDSLYPLTWSCEGYKDMNEYFTKQCGKCWWCKERIWGFGKI